MGNYPRSWPSFIWIQPRDQTRSVCECELHGSAASWFSEQRWEFASGYWARCSRQHIRTSTSESKRHRGMACCQWQGDLQYNILVGDERRGRSSLHLCGWCLLHHFSQTAIPYPPYQVSHPCCPGGHHRTYRIPLCRAFVVARSRCHCVNFCA